MWQIKKPDCIFRNRNLSGLTGHQSVLRSITPERVWLLFPPLGRPAMAEGVVDYNQGNHSKVY